MAVERAVTTFWYLRGTWSEGLRAPGISGQQIGADGDSTAVGLEARLKLIGMRLAVRMEDARRARARADKDGFERLAVFDGDGKYTVADCTGTDADVDVGFPVRWTDVVQSTGSLTQAMRGKWDDRGRYRSREFKARIHARCLALMPIAMRALLIEPRSAGVAHAGDPDAHAAKTLTRAMFSDDESLQSADRVAAVTGDTEAALSMVIIHQEYALRLVIEWMTIYHVAFYHAHVAHCAELAQTGHAHAVTEEQLAANTRIYATTAIENSDFMTAVASGVEACVGRASLIKSAACTVDVPNGIGQKQDLGACVLYAALQSSHPGIGPGSTACVIIPGTLAESLADTQKLYASSLVFPCVFDPDARAVGASATGCLRPIASGFSLVHRATGKLSVPVVTWFPTVCASETAPVASSLEANEVKPAHREKPTKRKERTPEEEVAGKSRKQDRKDKKEEKKQKKTEEWIPPPVLPVPPPVGSAGPGPLTARARAFLRAAEDGNIADNQIGPPPSDRWRACDLFVPLADELKRVFPCLGMLNFTLQLTAARIKCFLTNDVKTFDQKGALRAYMELYERVCDDATSLAPGRGLDTRPQLDATQLVINAQPRAQ